MLSSYQCETVAFAHNGAIICPECAVKATSTITVAKAEQGLSHGGGDLSAWSRYTLGSYISESSYDEDEPADSLDCEHCGQELS